MDFYIIETFLHFLSFLMNEMDKIQIYHHSAKSLLLKSAIKRGQENLSPIPD